MFKLSDLPYSYDALEPFIDEQTMHLHYDKHHATYVTNLNDALKDQERLLTLPIEELLKNLDQVPEALRIKVRNNAGGHANHTFFWEVMTKAKGQLPQNKLKKAIDSTFGNLEKMQEAFSKAALGRFGSGWVWLVSKEGRLEIVDTPNQDSPVMTGQTGMVPVLGLDVWEHAYYLKYQNRRADYVTAWWNVVNWEKVEENFGKTS